MASQDTTGAGRTEIWEVGVRALARFGIVGAGLQNFVDVHRLYVPHGPYDTAMGAHNIYLSAWVEVGAIGLLLMLAFGVATAVAVFTLVRS